VRQERLDLQVLQEIQAQRAQWEKLDLPELWEKLDLLVPQELMDPMD
jgi:hypothetical protein